MQNHKHHLYRTLNNLVLLNLASSSFKGLLPSANAFSALLAKKGFLCYFFLSMLGHVSIKLNNLKKTFFFNTLNILWHEKNVL